MESDPAVLDVRDLADPGVLLRDEVVADPRALYDVLRRDAPVWQIPGQDTFLVSDPGLVREAVGRPEDFSSNLVSLLRSDEQRCPVAFDLSPFGDATNVLATADPPIHTRHRRLLQKHLSPAAVTALGPAVEAIVDEQLTPLLGAGPVDFVAGFSDPVPARTVCALIGLPDGNLPRILDVVARTGPLLDGVTDAQGVEGAMHAAFDLMVFVHEALDAALARPPEERTGLLAVFADDIAAGEVTEDEVKNMLLILVSAGSETTASLLATAVEALAADPDRQAWLRNHPDGIADFIEDLLRDQGPFQFHYRYAPGDTTLGGVAIPAHSRVLLMWAAANRPAPGAPGVPTGAGVDGRRPPHYAFGKGMHFCIGAPVARMEARLALEQVLARTTSIALVPDDPPTRRPSIFMRRHARLPVVLTPA